MEQEQEFEGEVKEINEEDFCPVIEGDGLPIEEVITSLREGEPIFQCRGIAKVKVGKRIRPIPVRSVDMEQIVKALASKRPKPPTKDVLIKANSSQGRELGLTKNKYIIASNEADEAYQESLQEYNAELGYLVILNGLDTKLEDKNGKVVWDPADKKRQDKDEALRILRGMGMTGWQFSQISDEIRNLTKFEEEEMEKNLEEGWE